MADTRLSCPRCDATVPSVAGSVPVDGSERELRVPVECPDCVAPLSLVVTRVRERDEIGVELWLEDRREDPSE